MTSTTSITYTCCGELYQHGDILTDLDFVAELEVETGRMVEGNQCPFCGSVGQSLDDLAEQQAYERDNDYSAKPMKELYDEAWAEHAATHQR